MSDEEEDIQLSLNDSFNSLQLSETDTHAEDKPKAEHILHNVEEWKSRKDAREKTDAVEKLQQFKVKIIALEKEKSSQLFGKKHEFRKEFCDLEEQEVKLSSDRSKEFLEKLKMLMEDIESSILKYKQQQGALYEDMMNEEKQLSLDLESFEKKIQSWSTSSGGLPIQPKNKQKDDKKNLSVPPEVKAFQNFLFQTGGHQGGWDEYDHQTFLKLKKKYKVFEEFVNNAESEIPTRSKEDIIQHNAWYKEYIILRENKRTAIAEWKNMKESEKQEKLLQIEDDVEAEKRREIKRKEMIEREKMERFAELEKWKFAKELQVQETEEARRKRLAEERARKAEAEQRRREDVKAKVQAYQRKKKEENDILELARKVREEEEKEAKKISEEELARIKERDTRILEERKRRHDQREKERKEKEKRLNKLRGQVAVKVERDPSRLYQMTEGWKERQRSAREENAQPQQQFQRRAVPSWRQGMH
eukprot:gene5900-11235_t